MTASQPADDVDALARNIRDRVLDLALSPYGDQVPSAAFYELLMLLPKDWLPAAADIAEVANEHVGDAGLVHVLTALGYVSVAWSRASSLGSASRIESAVHRWPRELAIKIDTSVADLSKPVTVLERNSVHLVSGDQTLLSLPSTRSDRPRHDYLRVLAEICSAAASCTEL